MYIKKIRGWCCAGLLLPAMAFAQNNPIFKGGFGDGWASGIINQATGSNITKGGFGDGWSSGSINRTTGNNITKGGFGDGWATTTYLNAYTDVRKGGFGDGWVVGGYSKAYIDVRKGGIGDGWASTYKPQSALPVVMAYFTAKKEGSTTSFLEWKTETEVNTSHFEIERSTDAVEFRFLGKVLASGNSTSAMVYNFIDQHPAKGLNYYRLKQVDLDGKVVYTPTRLLRFDDMGAGIVKYYPNPTNGILHIDVTPQMLTEQLVINISNAGGVTLNQVKIGAGSFNATSLQVSLANYAKGVYFIQVKTPTVNSTQRVVLQ